MGVIDFVYKIEDAEGGEGNKDKDDGWENCSDNLNFLGIKNVLVCELSGDYGDNNIKYQGTNKKNNY